MDLFAWSAALMILFAALSTIDGLYLHLVRFKLHARKSSRREHVIHGVRGLLLIPTLIFVLSATTSGWRLWLGVAFVALDVFVTMLDVLEERDSRAFQGGLPRYELALHVALSVTHVAAIATSMLARPTAAWLTETAIDASSALLAEAVAIHGLLGGTIFVTVLHAALLHPRFRLRSGSLAAKPLVSA